MRSPTVDLTDLEIVDAVQISPRATWATISAAVGLSQATVSRRWACLHAQGLAWTCVALHPAATKGAFIEIRCPEGEVRALAESLMRHPDVITVGHTTGEYNLYLITVATTLDGVLQGLHGGIPELRSTEHLRTSLFRQLTGGVHWNQGILPPGEEKHLKASSTQGRDVAPVIGTADRDLFRELGRDGRRSAVALGQRLGRSPASIRRRIQSLVDARQIIFRTDVARPVFDLPLGMVVLMKAPPASANNVASTLGRWRQTRFCAGVIGASNIILIVGLHDLLDAERMLNRLNEEFPDVEIQDRRISTRMTKIYGNLLDELGRSVDVVPVDPWIRTGTSER